MRLRQFWRLLGSSWLLAVGLASTPGCLNCCHPLPPANAELTTPCEELPPCCRRHVCIFVLNGIDPLSCSNLSGLEEHLHKLGFNQTYFGQCYHAPWFAHVIRHLHHDDPEARFVLIGFDVGAKAACWTAEMVESAHVPIDLLVYLDGCLLSKEPGAKPCNVHQVINVVAGCGQAIEGTEHVDALGVGHYGTPASPATLVRLAQALADVAMQVPVRPEPEPMPALMPVPYQPAPSPPSQEEMAPTPRPVPAPEKKERDEWDFLKPTDHLQPLPEAASSARPVDIRP
jgi:hypothetical protein